MGDTGAHKSDTYTFEVDNERYDSYSLSDEQRNSMTASVEDVKSVVTDFMNDPWQTKDTEHLYESLADAYPRAIYGDDAEKVTWVDERNEFVTTVRISMLDNDRTGKLEVSLRPASYSFSEFSDDELRDMGVKRS